jgi:hypothetical protein
MTALGLPKCFMRSASVITVYIKCVKTASEESKDGKSNDCSERIPRCTGVCDLGS